MNELSDQELVQRVRQGTQIETEKAFEILVRRHSPWLTKMTTKLVGYHGDDVAQDTFVMAYEKLGDLKGDFRPWLRTIALRMAYRRFRRKKVENKYEQSSAELTTDRFAKTESFHEREAIDLVLGKLSYVFREIVVLRYIEELTVDEISVALDLGKSAVKMRLKRARDQFRSLYEELNHE